MASFRAHGNGWQARVRRIGQPDQTKTFPTKADAEKWARSVESLDEAHCSVGTCDGNAKRA
jgi:hypothetical protein